MSLILVGILYIFRYAVSKSSRASYC